MQCGIKSHPQRVVLEGCFRYLISLNTFCATATVGAGLIYRPATGLEELGTCLTMFRPGLRQEKIFTAITPYLMRYLQSCDLTKFIRLIAENLLNNHVKFLRKTLSHL